LQETKRVSLRQMIFNLLQRIYRSFNEHGIKYMVSGSIAMNLYAIPPMTRDLDIVLELSEIQIDHFIELFPDSYFNKEVIAREIKRKGMFNIIDHSTGFKIDLIIRKEGEYAELAFNNRKIIHELGTDLWVIQLNDLIIAKLIWIQDLQSERQMYDIKNLLLNPGKDIKYIKNGVENFN
jgi:hypothetical protein